MPSTNIQFKFSLRSTKYSISIRGQKIWNQFLTHEQKSLQSHKLFLKKSSLPDTENEKKNISGILVNFNKLKYTSGV